VQISWCALVVVPVGAAGIIAFHPSGVSGSVLCGGRGRVMGCNCSVRFNEFLAKHETAKIHFEIAKICLHYADK